METKQEEEQEKCKAKLKKEMAANQKKMLEEEMKGEKLALKKSLEAMLTQM